VSVRVRTVGGPISAEGGVVPGQVAKIIVALDGEPGWRVSGYRVGRRRCTSSRVRCRYGWLPRSASEMLPMVCWTWDVSSSAGCSCRPPYCCGAATESLRAANIKPGQPG
jgi:hypothetical protein